jgi:hypothetical protein
MAHTQPKQENADGTYTPIPTMNRQEWDALRAEPVSDWAQGLFKRQITVNSAARVIVRGQRKRIITKEAAHV